MVIPSPFLIEGELFEYCEMGKYPNIKAYYPNKKITRSDMDMAWKILKDKIPNIFYNGKKLDFKSLCDLCKEEIKVCTIEKKEWDIDRDENGIPKKFDNFLFGSQRELDFWETITIFLYKS